MKKCAFIMLMMTSSAYAQKVYRLTSVTTYDSLGNQYGIYKEYDHIPTSEDSAKFEKDSRGSINEIIVKRNQNKKNSHTKNTTYIKKE